MSETDENEEAQETTFVPPPGDRPADRLARVFHQAFGVMDIAEPLVSFDDAAPAIEVRDYLETRGWQLVGVRTEGLVSGYGLREEIWEGKLGDYAHPFAPDDLVPASASLAETIDSLEKNGRCFVSALGRVAAIVTLRDLEKPPVRMWLFGLVTLVEMQLGRAIAQHWTEEEWMAALTPARIRIAKELQAERVRRGRDVSLLDCIQFSDKAKVVVKQPGVAEQIGFPSRRQAEIAFQQLQSLRNDLAHAQEIVSEDWPSLVLLARNLERVVRTA